MTNIWYGAWNSESKKFEVVAESRRQIKLYCNKHGCHFMYVLSRTYLKLRRSGVPELMTRSQKKVGTAYDWIG